MALKDYLRQNDSHKKIGISEERINAVKPLIRKYIAFWREYPDLFVDFLVRGNKEEDLTDNTFHFYYYQRLFLRAVMRHQYVYATFPRAYSKSFLTVLSMMIRCILYPRANLFVTSGGKEQAASILQTKVRELCTLIPALEREIDWSRGATSEGKDKVKFVFKNGSVLDNLAARESSRGQRRHGGTIEESIGVDATILREVIIPVMAIDRRAMDGSKHPEEPLNKSQVHITTAGFKGTEAYEKLISFLVRMVTDPDRCIVLGGTWRTPVAVGLQPKTFIQDQKNEGTFNEISFGREYESRWAGTSENSFFRAETFDRHRKLLQPEYEFSERSSSAAYYVLGVDVGRKGCESSVTVWKVTPQPAGLPIKTMVNIYSFYDEHFGKQCIEIKKLYYKYKARRIVIDANGIGGGLVDYLVVKQIEEDGTVYPPFGVYGGTNKNAYSDYKKYITKDTELDVLYLMYANPAINSVAHTNFQSQLTSGKLKFLIDERTAREKLMGTKKGQGMTPEERAEYLKPFTLTSILREELQNLKEETDGINVKLKQINTKIPKDKFSSAEYALYYIKEEEEGKKRKRFSAKDMMFFT